MHIHGDTRAERFVDDYVEPIERKGGRANMMESAELSALKSRLNQVSGRSKNILVSTEHLVVFAEAVMNVLEVISKDIKMLQQQKR